MSIRVMTAVWELPERVGINGTELLLLLALADAANDAGVCWPGKGNLARKTGTSPATVKRTIRKLEERGLVAVEAVEGSTNRYRITLPTGGGQSDPPHREGGVNMTPGGVTATTPRGGHSYDPRTVIEPSGTKHTAADASGESELPIVVHATLRAEAAFEAWWEQYPRKVGKGAARTAYKAALRSTTPEQLLEALEAHKAMWTRTRTEDRFVPHPRTWLAQGRYDDELPAAPPADEGWDGVKWNN